MYGGVDSLHTCIQVQLSDSVSHFIQMLWGLLDPSLYKTYSLLKKITDTKTGFFYVPSPESCCWMTPKLKAFKNHISSHPNWEKPQEK